MDRLLDDHNLKHIDKDWMKQCCEFVKLSNRPIDAAWNQILYSDMEDMVTSTLLPLLSEQHKYRIQSNKGYMFQILSIVEVGTSKYAQLEHIKTIQTLNSNATLKHSMLKILLTDGVQQVFAMELAQTCLHLMLPLGTKVLLCNN